MSLTIKKLFKPAWMMLMTLGFDPRKALSLRNYLEYRRNLKEYQNLGGNITHRHMILNDFSEQAGSAKGHYFHQDLLVAKFIHQRNPNRHIDIGSRVDGFVAHVAAYRPIEVVDIRDLESTGHESIIFMKADLMISNELQHEITDSLSCLHAIEHFGLGRYGDPIDPQGHIKGFNNLLKMLKPNGILYISLPIGCQNEVHFNAHRVFHPTDILNWAYGKDALRLECLDFVDDAGDLHKNIDIKNEKVEVIYGCGIYTFRKIH